MPRASANGDLSDRMLASIRLTDEAEEASAVNRITELVALADRGGDDAFDLLGAAMTIRESGLDGDEIRMLHQTLQQKRTDDTARRSSLRMILLTMLTADTGSARLAALRQIYPTFDELPIHRAMLRAVLAESGTAEAISWLCDLLLEEKDTSGAAEEYALSILARDLSTAHLLFPKLATLMENPDHSYLLLSLLYRALDSNKVLPSSVVAERPRIIGIVTRAMADTGRHALWRAVRGIQVLSSLPRDEQTEELFLRALDSRKIEVSYAAVIALIRTEGDLERLSFTQYAAKPRYRLQLYRELEKKNLVDRFPQRYLTQNAISEGALAEWLESEDVEMPKEFINFDSREVTVDGTVYRAYLFKFRYTSKSKDWMVGLGSLQPLDATQIDFTDQHARSLYRRLYTATTEEHLDALLAPPSTESSYRSFEFISPTEEAEATEE
jgi:hypothetical protein